MNRVSLFLKSVADASGPEDTIDLRHEWRLVICGDDGAQPSSIDQCPKCGGFAQPLMNRAMARRLRRSR